MTATSRSGFLPDRTVHLHATRLCNLACRHCYSSSSPRTREAIALPVLARSLSLLRSEGYEVLSLSGGEPLLYAPFRELNGLARELGFRVVAISNGYRVRPEFDKLLETLDGVAISFDGLGAVHDRMRGRNGAFEVAIAALRHLHTLGMPAAAAYTVTQESLRDIPEFVDLASDCGVRAVQLRPLVMVGRATAECATIALSPADLERLYLIGASLEQAYRGEVAIHTDLAHSEQIVESRADYSVVLDGDLDKSPLADLVNPLVITPAGTLKPMTYDFPAGYDLGDIGEFNELGSAPMRRRQLPAFRGLIRDAFDELETRQEFVDWFAFCRDFAADARRADSAL